MAAWRRLLVVCEGQTESAFVKSVLTPHLATREIDVCAPVVVTNRKLGKRGGIVNFEKVQRDLSLHLRKETHPETRFTTMFDFYALPSEFPGWSAAEPATTPAARAAAIERELEKSLDDQRFFAFLQLHEFEALLFCDLEQLAKRIEGSESGVERLKKSVRGIEPEDINDGPTTAPSKRIIEHVPRYEGSKVRVGAPAAAAIGLDTLRAKCPHFGEWVTRLEALGVR